MNSYNTDKRFYGLDALRGIAMMLGIVLHAALHYVVYDVPGWTSEKSDSEIITQKIKFIVLSKV